MEPRPGAYDGRGRWIAVSAMWVRAFVVSGLLKSLGLMLPILQDQLHSTTWILGWTISLVTVVSGILGPFVKPITRPYQPGYTFMICGTMMAVACILGSFATAPTHLALSFILLAGTSCGVSNIIVKEVVARGFSKNYATAVSIGYTGASCGLFMLPPLTQLFLNTYGWRGTLLLLGSIFFHMAVCGALMVAFGIPQTSGYHQLSEVHTSSSDEAHQTPLRNLCSFFSKGFFKDLDLGLLLSARYWAVAVIRCLTTLPYDMWIIYFVSLAESIGFSLEEATTLVTVAGVANLLARVVQGPVIDRRLVPQWVLMGVTVIAMSVAFCSSPWLTSYWLAMAASTVIVVGNSLLFCSIDVIIRDVVGIEYLAGVYGWIGLKSAILGIALGFFPGWIYDVTGSFRIAFVVIGCLQGSILVPLLLLKYFQIID